MPSSPNNKKQHLFDDEEQEKQDDSSSSSSSIRINQAYATAYQTRKEQQELREAGDGDESSSSEEEEEEDEDGNLLTTPTMDVTIFKTINALRNKDESIYDPCTRFFDKSSSSSNDSEDESKDDSDAAGDERSAPKKHKPKKYKDVIREQILQQIKEEDGEGSSYSSKQPQKTDKMSKLEYDEEQRALRSAFLDSSTTADKNDENEDWMVVKEKKKKKNVVDNDKVKLQADKLLQKELEVLEQTVAGDDDTLRDPRGEVENGQQFLLDFLKNKKWMDKTEQSAESSSDDEENENENNNKSDDDDDSIQQLDMADDFEAKYNFRFEEALAGTSGADWSLKNYARGSDAVRTLRRKDETRRLKRLQRKEKKAAERQEKEEQLRRLKNAKRREMTQKLQQIKSILGSRNNHNHETMDEATMMKLMEGDYDPSQFDQAMEQAYNDDFYQQPDEEWKTDAQVRESLLKDNGEDLVGVGEEEDADGAMYDNYNDNDDDDEEEEEETGETEEQGGAANDEEQWEDVVYKDEANVEETEAERKLKEKMMDELYKLDYEDIVAGMPTRFKYRKVEPNNYGLSTQEILFARDTTLKQFVSLKKMAPYREEGEYYVTGKKRRRFRDIVKQEMEEVMEKAQKASGDAKETIEQEQPKKKRRRQKKGKKKADDVANQEAAGQQEEKEPAEQEKTSKRRRKKKGSKKQQSEHALANENEQDSGDKDKDPLNTDKSVLETSSSANQSSQPEQLTKMEGLINKHGEKKKKKKRRKKKALVEGVSASRLASYGL